MPFNKKTNNYRDRNIYHAEYELRIECFDKKYIVYYQHKRFTYNSELKDITLSSLKEERDIFNDWYDNYEYRINKLLYSLNHFVKTNELIK